MLFLLLLLLHLLVLPQGFGLMSTVFSLFFSRKDYFYLLLKLQHSALISYFFTRFPSFLCFLYPLHSEAAISAEQTESSFISGCPLCSSWATSIYLHYSSIKTQVWNKMVGLAEGLQRWEEQHHWPQHTRGEVAMPALKGPGSFKKVIYRSCEPQWLTLKEIGRLCNLWLLS